MRLRPPERRWLLVVGALVLVGLVALATVPVYAFAEPRWRPLVVRVASALVLGVLLRQVGKAISHRVQRDLASTFDDALTPPVDEPGVDRRLVELVAEVRGAVRSRRAFERGLWPRLSTLARTPLVSPKPRRFGRGPSLLALRAVIEALERQR